MEYWLLFWRAADGDVAAGAPAAAEIADQLRVGRWECVPPDAGVAELRRDLVASDPDWPTMTLQPRPGSGVPTDRYLGLVFSETPDADELRDLRYVAARNRLTMYDPQRPDHGESSTG